MIFHDGISRTRQEQSLKMSQSSKNSQLKLNIMLAISKTFVLSLSVLDSLVAKQAEIPEVQAH